MEVRFNPLNGLWSNLNAAGDALGTTATGVIGSLVNDVSGVSATNAFNASEAQKQRDWEEQMANTQVQRTVADMKAAGLNPATIASGSMSLNSLPSGSAATGSGNGGSVITGTLNAVVQIAKLIAKLAA